MLPPLQLPVSAWALSIHFTRIAPPSFTALWQQNDVAAPPCSEIICSCCSLSSPQFYQFSTQSISNRQSSLKTLLRFSPAWPTNRRMSQASDESSSLTSNSFIAVKPDGVQVCLEARLVQHDLTSSSVTLSATSPPDLRREASS